MNNYLKVETIHDSLGNSPSTDLAVDRGETVMEFLDTLII
jgi:hypothetical protein